MSVPIRHDIAYLILALLALGFAAAAVVLRARRRSRRVASTRIDLGVRSDQP
jgi:hypothetical protein